MGKLENKINKTRIISTIAGVGLAATVPYLASNVEDFPRMMMMTPLAPIMVETITRVVKGEKANPTQDILELGAVLGTYLTSFNYFYN